MVGTCSVCGTVSDVIVIADRNGEDSLICEGHCKFAPPTAAAHSESVLRCDCEEFNNSCPVCQKAMNEAVDKLEMGMDYTPPTYEQKALFRRWLNDSDPVMNLAWFEAGGCADLD